jgi:hypothetical protein
MYEALTGYSFSSIKKRNKNCMKKILAALIVTGFLMACNSKNDSENSAAPDTAAETQHKNAEKATGLVLNNGAKWKADSTTLLNVQSLQNIISNAKKESVKNYSQTATQLQDGLNKMINECKMKGADHDALHQWLEPIIEKTKDLKNAANVENASAILIEVENRINLFPQYFEQS